MTTDVYKRWRSVQLSAGVLLGGSVIPLPERDVGTLGTDKALHGVAHAWLVLALADALRAEGVSTSGSVVAAVTASAAYGLLIELLQQRVPGRRYERGDVVASALGSVLGALYWARSRGKASDHTDRSRARGPVPRAASLYSQTTNRCT